MKISAWLVGLALLAMVAIVTKQKLDRSAFKAKVGPAAQKMAAAIGVPVIAEYAIAQAAIESDLGNSQLASLYNNFFGIKQGVKDTVGHTYVELATQEFLNGQYVTVRANFARYKTIDDSFLDWGNYIVRKYPDAITAARRSDAAGFFAALQKGGYATDPRYALKLQSSYDALYA